MWRRIFWICALCGEINEVFCSTIQTSAVTSFITWCIRIVCVSVAIQTDKLWQSFFCFFALHPSSSIVLRASAGACHRFLEATQNNLEKYLHIPEAWFHLFTTGEQIFNILAHTSLLTIFFFLWYCLICRVIQIWSSLVPKCAPCWLQMPVRT